MKKTLALLLVGAAFAAWAGTRAKDTSGAVPSTSTDGVSLVEVIACRPSVRVADAGTLQGGKLIPYYYDAVLGWVESHSDLHCTISPRADGGSRSAFVCPDMPVAARYGRIAMHTSGLIGADGGSPNGFALPLSDGGIPQTVAPVVRVECYGPALP